MPEQIFTTAPEAVRRYFDDKKQVPSFDWRDVTPQEHAHTMTVAKTTGFNVLGDIRGAVKEAIDNQQSFEEFYENLAPTLRKKGWWGKKIVIDPKTGLKFKAQLGSPRRLRTIHWANVATARAAGEWERTLATQEFLPLLAYLRSTSVNKRPEHLAWVGIILPVVHVWWHSHYPPNTWGCLCRVRQLSRSQAIRLGYSEDDEAPIIETRPWLNKRTGRSHDVPIGIDPGWDTHPGMNRGRKLMDIYSDKLQEMPPDAVANALQSFWNGSQPRAWLNGSERVHMPVALSDRARKHFGSVTSAISISSDTLSAKLGKHSNLKLDILAGAAAMIEAGDWRVGRSPGSIEIYSEFDNSLWRVVVAKSAKGFLFLRTIHQVRRANVRGPKVE